MLETLNLNTAWWQSGCYTGVQGWTIKPLHTGVGTFNVMARGRDVKGIAIFHLGDPVADDGNLEVAIEGDMTPMEFKVAVEAGYADFSWQDTDPVPATAGALIVITHRILQEGRL